MRSWAWGIIVLAVAAVSGCASFPAKGAPDESLVVIKTEFINPENLPRGFEVVFRFSDGYPDSWVGQYSWDYSLVKVNAPGATLASLGTKVGGGFRGDEKAYNLDIPLPYEAGHIVIADFVFVHTMRKTGDNAQSSRFDFRAITPQEKDDLMAALKEDGRLDSWMP